MKGMKTNKFAQQYDLSEPRGRAVWKGSLVLASVFSGVILVCLFFFPVLFGVNVCVDDFWWIRLAHATPSLGESLIQAWHSYFFFRPIDIVANWFIDPVSLNSTPTLPFQAIGLFLLLASVWRLSLILVGWRPLAHVMAIVWLLLHPATQLSVWASGVASQTWCAALGLWLLCHVIKPFSCASESKYCIVQSLLISSVGVIAKELFVGWATAASIVVLIKMYHRSHRDSDKWFVLSVVHIAAILGPAALWVTLRMATSEFGDFAKVDSDLHYSFHGFYAVARNSVFASVGLFVQGPIHWAMLSGFPKNAVPIVGAAISLGLAARGSSYCNRTMNGMGAPPLYWLALFWGLGLIAIWPAIAVRQVAEIYMMGPNALISVLVGIGAASCGSVAGVEKKNSMRNWPHFPMRQTSVAVLILIGTVGFISRAYHFALTWHYAQGLRAAAVELVQRHQDEGPLTILIDPALDSRGGHSKYVCSPVLAANLQNSFRSFELGGAGFPNVVFQSEPNAADTDLRSTRVIRLRADLPPRHPW